MASVAAPLVPTRKVSSSGAAAIAVHRTRSSQSDSGTPISAPATVIGRS